MVDFPTTREEAANWKPTVRVRALSRQVLAVARTRIEGAWAAYCDAVPGIKHDDEFEQVLLDGSKLPEHVAAAIFTEFAQIPYAR